MSALTSRLGLPYPVDSDPVNVAGDLQALALEIDAKLNAQVGDLKLSVQAANHGDLGTGRFLWLLADGVELDASYTELIDVLTTAGVPYGTGANGRPKLPDLRGRVPVMPGTPTGAAGATNHPLGQVGGEEKHTLTSQELPVETGANVTMGALKFWGTTTQPANGRDFYTPYNTPMNNLQPYVAAGYWFVRTV